MSRKIPGLKSPSEKSCLLVENTHHGLQEWEVRFYRVCATWGFPSFSRAGIMWSNSDTRTQTCLSSLALTVRLAFITKNEPNFKCICFFCSHPKQREKGYAGYWERTPVTNADTARNTEARVRALSPDWPNPTFTSDLTLSAPSVPRQGVLTGSRFLGCCEI